VFEERIKKVNRGGEDRREERREERREKMKKR
jgi:hypothetical protein